MADAPNYYDQFNHRIDEIAKPNAAPPSSGANGSSGGGGGGWGWGGGGGIAIAIFIGIRVLLFATRSSGPSSPPPPPIIIPPQQQFMPQPLPPNIADDDWRPQAQERQRRWDRGPEKDGLPPIRERR